MPKVRPEISMVCSVLHYITHKLTVALLDPGDCCGWVGGCVPVLTSKICKQKII